MYGCVLKKGGCLFLLIKGGVLSVLVSENKGQSVCQNAIFIPKYANFMLNQLPRNDHFLMPLKPTKSCYFCVKFFRSGRILGYIEYLRLHTLFFA